MSNKTSKNSLISKIVLGVFVLIYSIVAIIGYLTPDWSLSNSVYSICLYVIIIVTLVLFCLVLFLKENKVLTLITLCIPLIYTIMDSILIRKFAYFYFSFGLGLAAIGVLSLLNKDKYSLVVGGAVILLGTIIQIIYETIVYQELIIPFYFNELFVGVGILVVGILYLLPKTKNVLKILWFIPVVAWLLGSFSFAIYVQVSGMIINTSIIGIIYESLFSVLGIVLLTPLATLGLYISRLENK